MINCCITGFEQPVEQGKKPVIPLPVGFVTVHVYVVPDAIWLLNAIFVDPSLQIVEALLVATPTGSGLTVTVVVNVAPIQLFDEVGVIVYVTVPGVVLTLVSV